MIKPTIDEGIATILKEPERDFSLNPLNQLEITGIIETLVHEINDEKIDEDLAQYYIGIVEFLKTKIFYN